MTTLRRGAEELHARVCPDGQRLGRRLFVNSRRVHAFKLQRLRELRDGGTNNRPDNDVVIDPKLSNGDHSAVDSSNDED